MKNLLIIPILLTSIFFSEYFIIINIEKKYLRVDFDENFNEDLLIKDQFNYAFYFHKEKESIDFNKLAPNKFHILIEYKEEKPILKFFSISNKNFDSNSKLLKDDRTLIKEKNVPTIMFPLEKYEASSIYLRYRNIGTKFFDYVEFPEDSKFIIKIYYRCQNICEPKVFMSNTIELNT